MADFLRRAYHSLPSSSSLYNMAFNYAAPKALGAFDKYMGTNVAQDIMQGNAAEGFNKMGSSIANTGRDFFRNNLDAALPQHVGYGYGMKANPKFKIYETPRLSDSLMNTPIETIGQDAGRVLGGYGSKEALEKYAVNSGHPEYYDKYLGYIEPYAQMIGSNIGKGIGWGAQKLLNPFMPTGYAQMTPNELTGYFGQKIGHRLQSLAPHQYGGNYAHGGSTDAFLPTLRDIAEMMPALTSSHY